MRQARLSIPLDGPDETHKASVATDLAAGWSSVARDVRQPGERCLIESGTRREVSHAHATQAHHADH
jgi:hypothetical protein